jgi:hypothetical protein
MWGRLRSKSKYGEISVYQNRLGKEITFVMHFHYTDTHKQFQNELHTCKKPKSRHNFHIYIAPKLVICSVQSTFMPISQKIVEALQCSPTRRPKRLFWSLLSTKALTISCHDVSLHNSNGTFIVSVNVFFPVLQCHIITRSWVTYAATMTSLATHVKPSYSTLASSSCYKWCQFLKISIVLQFKIRNHFAAQFWLCESSA